MRLAAAPRYGLVRGAADVRAWRRGGRAGGGGMMATADAGSQITDLAADDHACLTFGEPEELFDLTAAFVRDGLARGLKVVWVTDATPDRATAELARRGIAVEEALASGQLVAASYDGRLLDGQVFSAGHAMTWLEREMQRAGNQGLR